MKISAKSRLILPRISVVIFITEIFSRSEISPRLTAQDGSVSATHERVINSSEDGANCKGGQTSNGFHNGRSYVDAVNRKHGPHSSEDGVKTVDSENEMEKQPNLALYKHLKCCLVGELRAYETLQNLGSILKADGLGECCIHYIGGLSVLLEWSSQKAAGEVLSRNAQGLSKWFEKIQLWSDSVDTPGRLVWLRLEGLPVQAWGAEAVTKIAQVCGRVSKVKINNRTHYIKISEDVIRSSLIKLNFNMEGSVSGEDTQSSEESQTSEESSFENELDVEFGDLNYRDDEEISDQNGLMEGLVGDDLEIKDVDLTAGSYSSSGEIPSSVSQIADVAKGRHPA
ncbi:nucleotide-binding alpha-beta plait domain-containing protein [Tanacetum coccineum]